MGTYMLFIFVSALTFNGGNESHTLPYEFFSKQACEEAAAVIQQEVSSRKGKDFQTFKTICVARGNKVM
jgi:hypothetical protein